MSSPSTPDRLIPSAEELTEVVQAVRGVVATFTDENSRTARRGGQPDFEFWDKVLSGSTALGRLHNALHQPSLCHSLSETSEWPHSVPTSLVWLRALLEEMPSRPTSALRIAEQMSAAAAQIEEAVEYVHGSNTARRDADASGKAADETTLSPLPGDPSADEVHGALTNVYEVGAALVDVFKRFKNGKSERFVAMWAAIEPTWELLPTGRVTFAELERKRMRLANQFDAEQAARQIERASYLGRGLMASFATVLAPIDRWFEAKLVAARQIKRAAYLVDDLMAEGPQPSTVLCDKLHELERGCHMLSWLDPIRRLPGKMRTDSQAYCRDYSKLPLVQVINLRGQWDKLTGLLDGSGHGDIRSGGSAVDESAIQDGGQVAAQARGEKLLSIQETAKRLNIDRTTLRRWRNAKPPRVPASIFVTIGGKEKVLESKLDAWILKRSKESQKNLSDA